MLYNDMDVWRLKHGEMITLYYHFFRAFFTVLAPIRAQLSCRCFSCPPHNERSINNGDMMTMKEHTMSTRQRCVLPEYL